MYGEGKKAGTGCAVRKRVKAVRVRMLRCWEETVAVCTEGLPCGVRPILTSNMVVARRDCRATWCRSMKKPVQIASYFDCDQTLRYAMSAWVI